MICAFWKFVIMRRQRYRDGCGEIGKRRSNQINTKYNGRIKSRIRVCVGERVDRGPLTCNIWVETQRGTLRESQMKIKRSEFQEQWGKALEHRGSNVPAVSRGGWEESGQRRSSGGGGQRCHHKDLGSYTERGAQGGFEQRNDRI